mmetsp:Transcript_10722/g.34447  ORF Transcript_10722/g.34447 Transcript_10722/m.34447 type:complete len:228 (-) Transcript_10722:936-1619(-)|eukprot:scaffold25055_cov106-Isochrysis_galbana.AAC.6
MVSSSSAGSTSCMYCCARTEKRLMLGSGCLCRSSMSPVPPPAERRAGGTLPRTGSPAPAESEGAAAAATASSIARWRVQLQTWYTACCRQYILDAPDMRSAAELGAACQASEPMSVEAAAGAAAAARLLVSMIASSHSSGSSERSAVKMAPRVSPGVMSGSAAEAAVPAAAETTTSSPAPFPVGARSCWDSGASCGTISTGSGTSKSSGGAVSVKGLVPNAIGTPDV